MYLLDYSTGYTLETFWNPSIIIQACTVNMVFLQDYIKNLKMLFLFLFYCPQACPFSADSNSASDRTSPGTRP